MTDPRKHHFVPVMLQRRFTDAKGLLYVYDKRHPQAGVYRANPINAFVQRDLNTVVDKDGTRDASLEHWYSHFESEVAPIIDKIIVSARDGRTPQLKADERNTWDNYVYHQQKRAPDIFHKLGLVDDLEKALPDYIAEFERDVRPLTDSERAAFSFPETIERIVQTASVHARGRGGGEVITILAERGIAVARITQANKSFILGDHPLARMGPDGKLGHPATELWFPIAPDIAVSPWGNALEEKILELSGDDVRRANHTIFENSNVVAGVSEALLRSLAGL